MHSHLPRTTMNRRTCQWAQACRGSKKVSRVPKRTAVHQRLSLMSPRRGTFRKLAHDASHFSALPHWRAAHRFCSCWPPTIRIGTGMPNRNIDHAFTARSKTGASFEPTYAGALSFMRRRYSKDVKGADAVIWGVPFDAAVTNRPGARFGPQAIRRASAIMDNDPQYPFARDLFESLAVVDYGDCLLDTGNHHKTPATIEREAAKIIKSGAFLLTLGGDHFVPYPLLKAHAAIHGPLALVQFDAHQDTWPDDGKRIDHGSFVGRAVREGLIDPDRSIQVGIRTHAPETCG